MNGDRYTLHGWHLSYFSAKVRCYLAHKGVPFDDKAIDLWTLMVTVRRRTGVVVMPVLRTPEDRWLQDSSDIIDQLEQRFPARPVLPTTPRQRFAALLLEAWADEWWIPLAMHTRWSYPENYALFEHEAGTALLPRWPRALQRRAAASIAERLRGYLPVVGVRPAQLTMMDRWAHTTLDLFEAHFAVHPYLLGARPSLADFALAGPMYAHLGRDPWPKRTFIEPRPRLRAWIERMANPACDPALATPGATWLADDAIASTLEPIIALIAAEFGEQLRGIAQQVGGLAARFPRGKPLPRILADVEMPMGDARFRRAAMPYSLWMAQRYLDAAAALAAPDRVSLEDWLAKMDAASLLQLDFPRLRRNGLRVALV